MEESINQKSKRKAKNQWQSKTPTKRKKKVSNSEGEELVKMLNRSEYSVVEQLKKALA